MDITGVGRPRGSAFGRAPCVSKFRTKACFRNANLRRWWSGARRAAASPSVDGGAGGGSGGSGAAGGGGGGGEEGEERHRSEGLFRWKGWEDRVAADPQFPFKVFIEQVIGVGAAVVGDMSSRPNWGLNELDFVFSTLVVGSILNFSLMYLLAPTAGNAAAAGGLVQRLLSEEALKAMGAPGGHMFERGFSLGARGLNLLYKGWVFGIIGLLAGVVGTGTSNGLLMLRKRCDPSFVLQNEVPNVAMNASAWCLHMGMSSNVRYQILNGIDMVLAPAMSPALFKLVSTGYRTGNNVLGGISFVTIAKMLGAQKSAPSAESEASK